MAPIAVPSRVLDRKVIIRRETKMLAYLSCLCQPIQNGEFFCLQSEGPIGKHFLRLPGWFGGAGGAASSIGGEIGGRGGGHGVADQSAISAVPPSVRLGSRQPSFKRLHGLPLPTVDIGSHSSPAKAAAVIVLPLPLVRRFGRHLNDHAARAVFIQPHGCKSTPSSCSAVAVALIFQAAGSDAPHREAISSWGNVA